MGSRLEQLESLAEKNPDDNFIEYAIALEFVSIGRFKDAADLLEATMKRDPTYVPAFHQAGRTYEQMDEIDDARRCFELGIASAIERGDAHTRGEMEESLRMLD